jgi:hypothetical protein
MVMRSCHVLAGTDTREGVSNKGFFKEDCIIGLFFFFNQFNVHSHAGKQWSLSLKAV